MQILKHLFDNGLVGLALFAVLLIFLVAVGTAVYASIKNKPVLASNNFTYVATAVAGLVLSVASGVIGSPATVQIPNQFDLSQPNASRSPANPSSQNGTSPTTLQVRISNDQIAAFRTIYAWSYVLAGLVCLVVFVCPTPFTHDLVKSVGLTMLGFMITIVGGIVQPAQIPSNQQVSAQITTNS